MQLNILFLEDDVSDFDLISEKIKAEWNCNITRVINRETFTDKLQTGNFNLILADFALPGFNGLTALQIKNNIKPELPFIFVSGDIGEERAIEALTNGAADYVLKDKLEKLIPSIRRILKESEEKRKRLEAEDAHKRSEASLKEAQEIANMGSWELDLITFDYTWSENCFKIFGLNSINVKPEFEYFINHVYSEDLTLIEKASKEITSKIKEIISLEMRIIMPDKSLKWVESRLIPVFNQNKLIRLKGVLIDISERKKSEDILKQNEVLLNIAGRIGKIGGWVVELPDFEIHWSDEVALIHELPLGYKPDPEESLNFYAPEYRHIMSKRIEECIQYGTAFDETLELITAKQNRIWVRSIGEAIKDDSGNTIRVQGALQDITQTKKNEAQMLKLAERLQTTFESITDAFFTLDRQWRFTFVNKKAESLLRHSKEELIGNNIWEKFPEAANTVFYESYHKALSEKITIEFEDYFEPFNMWLEVHVYPSDEGLAVYFRDVTVRHLLKEESRKLIRAVEQSPVSIMITNWEGEIEYVNKKFCDTSGYRNVELIGKHSKILKSYYHDKKYYQNLWKTILAGKEWSGEILNKKKSGELYWEHEIISPITNSHGDITHFVSIKQDITEKKKMIEELTTAKESAEKSNKLKDAFIANISHEIRTPLNGILGLSSLIKEFYSEHMQDGDEELFTGIESSSKRLNRTVDMILNFSILETDKFPVNKKKIELSNIIKKLLPAFKAEITEKELEIIFEQRCEKSEIEGDEYTLTEAISNLISNAIKFTHQGFVKIIIVEEDNNIVVEIKDSGIGINSEYLDKIFEPYIQEDMGHIRKYEGIGLGLSLVKKFLDLNDASISVLSVKNEGATFEVKFKKKIL